MSARRKAYRAARLAVTHEVETVSALMSIGIPAEEAEDIFANVSPKQLKWVRKATPAQLEEFRDGLIKYIEERSS